MNAQQLRNSILQEAIEGRLVPQDPNDEPASVLLERIREEKRRLVKEGKLKKKDLVETPISEDEKPFEIPEGWEWCRIKWLISGTNAGKSPNCQKRPKEGEEWGVLTTTSIQNGFFLPEENKVLPNNYLIEKDYIVEKGDLLITRAGPKNRTGVVCVVNKKCDHLILSDKTVRISYIREWCNPFYLMYILNCSIIRSIILQSTVGMAESQVNISQSSIKKIIIPLPPLAEQKRIVAKIEELMPKVEEYGKAQEALDKLNAELPEKLKKSILQEAIEGRLVPQDPNDEPASVLLDKIRKKKAQLVKEGKLKKKDLVETPISEEEKPFEIPESWEWCRLGSVCDYLHRGKSPKYGIQKTLPIIAQKCNQWDKIYTDRCLFSDIDNIEKYTSEQYLQVGDVIINSTGGGTVGRTGIVEDYVFEDYSQFVADSHVTVVRANKQIVPKYIYYYLISPFIQWGIEDRCSGSTNQIELGTATIINYYLPIPPFAEQHRIVAKIEELFAGIEQLKK